MSFDDYQASWRAQRSPAAADLRNELDGVIASMSRSQAKQRLVLGACVVNSALAAGSVVYAIAVKRIPFNLDEIAPLLILQVVLALALAILVRRRYANQREIESATRTVREAAQIGVRGVEREFRDARLLGLVAFLALGFLAWAVSGLVGSGKMTSRDAGNFALLCGVILVTNALILSYRGKKVLLPRRRRLNAIIASLDGEPAAEAPPSRDQLPPQSEGR